MASHDYPHYPEHKAEHERLPDEYTEFMTRFERDYYFCGQAAIEGTLRRWIVDHILISDKQMSLMVTRGQQP